jgi:putative SOS response-associated peptidase YedK
LHIRRPPGWRPESYAILTIEANEDAAPFHARQMAVVLRRDRYAWINHTVPRPNSCARPLRTFRAEAEGAPSTLL